MATTSRVLCERSHNRKEIIAEPKKSLLPKCFLNSLSNNFIIKFMNVHSFFSKIFILFFQFIILKNNFKQIIIRIEFYFINDFIIRNEFYFINNLIMIFNDGLSLRFSMIVLQSFLNEEGSCLDILKIFL
jgi:hypothetical protein